MSFNAFNEGSRLIHCLKIHKRLFGVEAKKVGGERDTDIVREARKAVQRGIERERPCQTGTCQGEGDSDGGLVRHTERALRPKEGQGPDEADGNPVHVLRHSHGKRGAASGQIRAESTSGGCLKRKYAHRKVLSRGELRLCHREWTKNPSETTGMRYKKRKFGDPNAEMDGISRLLRSKQKTTIPK